MKEIWKPIKEYRGYYQVSNLGRIRGVDRIVASTHKNYKLRNIKGIYIKQRLSHRGYPIVFLSDTANKKRKSPVVHRIVAFAFIPNPLNLEEVNHINGIKTDNKINNLEWVTHRENIIHAHKNGLRVSPKGEKNGLSRLKNKDIFRIRKMYKKGILQKIIGIKFSVGQENISRIVNRKSWSHI